jgi:hypothetical protein
MFESRRSRDEFKFVADLFACFSCLAADRWPDKK